MEYGICNLAVIPMRAEPNDRSEQISQVLFGETFEILEWADKWVKIMTTADEYTGWIGRLQLVVLSHEAYKKLRQTTPVLTYRAVTQAWKIKNNSTLYLPMASSLNFFNGTSCYIESEKFEIIGQLGEAETIDVIAKSYLNTPYLWGGRSHFGIDCSGFTQAVFKLKGLQLKRDASLQAEQGAVVKSLSDAKLGDLAFFNNAEGRITHVAMLLNKEYVIHASGRVKIDIIDTTGIYSDDLKIHTHQLCLIKRYFKDI